MKFSSALIAAVAVTSVDAFGAFGKKPEPVKAAPAKKASPFAAFGKKPEPVKAAPAKKAAPAFSAPKIELPNPFPKSDVKKVFDGTVKKGPRVATRVFNLDLS